MMPILWILITFHIKGFHCYFELMNMINIYENIIDDLINTSFRTNLIPEDMSWEVIKKASKPYRNTLIALCHKIGFSVVRLFLFSKIFAIHDIKANTYIKIWKDLEPEGAQPFNLYEIFHRIQTHFEFYKDHNIEVPKGCAAPIVSADMQFRTPKLVEFFNSLLRYIEIKNSHSSSFPSINYNQMSIKDIIATIDTEVETISPEIYFPENIFFNKKKFFIFYMKCLNDLMEGFMIKSRVEDDLSAAFFNCMDIN